MDDELLARVEGTRVLRLPPTTREQALGRQGGGPVQFIARHVLSRRTALGLAAGHRRLAVRIVGRVVMSGDTSFG